jgi:transposase
MTEGDRKVGHLDDHAPGAAARIRQLEERVRELEWLLGRKALEVEILKEALAAARAHRPTLGCPAPEPDGSR